MSDLSALIKSRGNIKQQITKIFNFFSVERSSTQAEIKKNKLDQLYKDFDIVQSAIEQKSTETTDDEEISKAIAEAEIERDHIDSQYDTITRTISRILEKQEQEDIAHQTQAETTELSLLREQVRLLTLQNQNSTAQHSATQVNPPAHQSRSNIRRIKLTKFDPSQPQMWLSQIEMTLELEGITTEEEKFKQVFISLEGDCLTASEDLITDTSVTNKFTVFKKRILSRFAESAESKLRRLLKGADSKDKKPSIILAEMKRLAGGECGPKVMRECFMQTLPELTRNVLTVFENYSLDDLATAADKMYDSANNSQSTSSGIEQQSIQAVSQEDHMSYTELCRTVKELSEQIHAMKRYERPRSRSRSKFQNRGRSSSRDKDGQKLCFYHKRWSHNARKCEGSCSFNNNNNQGN